MSSLSQMNPSEAEEALLCQLLSVVRETPSDELAERVAAVLVEARTPAERGTRSGAHRSAPPAPDMGSGEVAVTCATCGRLFLVKRGSRGRPRTHCGPACREISSFLALLDSKTDRFIEVLERTPDGRVTAAGREACSRVRSRLWRAGNDFNRAGSMARAWGGAS